MSNELAEPLGTRNSELGTRIAEWCNGSTRVFGALWSGFESLLGNHESRVPCLTRRVRAPSQIRVVTRVAIPDNRKNGPRAGGSAHRFASSRASPSESSAVSCPRGMMCLTHQAS